VVDLLRRAESVSQSAGQWLSHPFRLKARHPSRPTKRDSVRVDLLDQ